MEDDLRPSSVTSALRKMLPAYVAHAGIIGWLYAFNPWGLVWGRPAVAAIEALAPLWLWGGLLFVWSGVLAGAMLAHSRTFARFAVIGYGITNAVWSVGYLAGALVDRDASLVAPNHTALIAVACFASAGSLRRGER